MQIQSECYAGRVAVRTEDNQLRVFVESREASNLSSDIILEQRWQLLHSNKVKIWFYLEIFIYVFFIYTYVILSGVKLNGKNCLV